MFAHPAVGEFFWGMRTSMGMPRLPSRSKRRLRGNREQGRLHGLWVRLQCVPQKFRESLPRAIPRRIPSCSAVAVATFATFQRWKFLAAFERDGNK